MEEVCCLKAHGDRRRTKLLQGSQVLKKKKQHQKRSKNIPLIMLIKSASPTVQINWKLCRVIQIHSVEDTSVCSLIKSSGSSVFSESCFDIITDLYSAAGACPHSFIQSAGLVAGDLWPPRSIYHF